MPTFDLDENQSHYQIRSFIPGTIKVNTTVYTRSLIIMPDQLLTDWPPQTVDDLSADSFALILPFKPDILLIGTGATLIFLPIDVYGDLINQRIGVEVMDTGAACRTFNALSSENRKVAAALLIR